MIIINIYIINQIIIKMGIEVPNIKNQYLAFKPLDRENIPQYPIQQEIIIQPYSIFEVLEINKL